MCDVAKVVGHLHLKLDLCMMYGYKATILAFNTTSYLYHYYNNCNYHGNNVYFNSDTMFYLWCMGTWETDI